MKTIALPGFCSRLSLSRFAALIAVGASVSLASACGDDMAVDAGLATIGDGASLTDGGAISGDDATAGSDASGVLDVAIIGGDANGGGGTGTDATTGTDTTVTDPNKSCAGKCGQYDAKAACQCDTKCVANGDCCGDYQGLCGTTSTGCGDGKCTPPENQQTCPADCGTITQPGSCVGKCGQYNKNWSCQCDDKCAANNDCCGDLASACPVTGPSCGDGTCNNGETNATCPKDCPATGGGGGPIATCVETNCASDVATCKADANCAKVFDCAKTCTDQNCLFGCVQQSGGGGFQLPNGLTGLYQCGQQNGCFTNGGGGGTTPTCGDGTCNNGETNATCPKDCPATGGGGGTTPIATCVETACPKDVATCQADPACAKVLTCAEACSDQNCLFGCVQQGGGGFQLPNGLTGLYQCGQQAGCFGGAGGGGGGPTTSCGDGTCNGTETNATCPKDCPAGGGGGTSTPDQCVATNCAKNYTDCQANATCKAALPCVESGKQVYNCMSSFDFQAGQILFQVQQCGSQNKCF